MGKVNKIKLNTCKIKNNNKTTIFDISEYTNKSFISVIYEYENTMGYSYVPIFSGEQVVQSIPEGLGNAFMYALKRPENLKIRNINIGSKTISFTNTMKTIDTWTQKISQGLYDQLSKTGIVEKNKKVGNNLYGYYFPKIWTGLQNRIPIKLKIQLQSNKDTKNEAYKLYTILRKHFQLKNIGGDFNDFYIDTGNANRFFFNNEILWVQLTSANFTGKRVDFTKPITSKYRFPTYIEADLTFELVSVYSKNIFKK